MESLHKRTSLLFVVVVPHITDAIQEWVERVAKQSVSEDGAKPEVTSVLKLQ